MGFPASLLCNRGQNSTPFFCISTPIWVFLHRLWALAPKVCQRWVGFYQQAIAKITKCLKFLMSQRRELNKELYRGLPLVGWLSLPWHILILKIPFVIRRTWCEYWRNLIYVILTWRILRWHIFGVWMKNCRIASFHMFVKTTVMNEPTTPSKNGSLLWFWRKKITLRNDLS